jgi:DNA-binding XRE family transcriptional regulator
MSGVEASERRRVGLAFGAALRAARKHKGMTQEQLADAAGFDRTFPTLLERGLRTPTLGHPKVNVFRMMRTISE